MPTTRTPCPDYRWCRVDHVEQEHRELVQHEQVQRDLVTYGIPGALEPGVHVPRTFRPDDLGPMHVHVVSSLLEVEACNGLVGLRITAEELTIAEARQLALDLPAALALLDG